jgi:probable DNA repair protein
LIRLPTDLSALIREDGTLVVPSRQRAHAARLAHAAAQLHAGRRVWPSPDILTAEAWLTRETEQVAASAGARLPRLLSAAEEWLLWRQCTAEATGELELVNRGALADALRRASALAAEYRIDVARLGDTPGTETALLQQVQAAVAARCRALQAAPLTSLQPDATSIGAGRAVCFGGFLSLPPRLKELAAAQPARHSNTAPLARPEVVIAADEQAQQERIAQWCRRLIESRPEARLLVVLPGAAGARERLATAIRQTVDPGGWLADGSHDALVVIEGGSPLARAPAVAHALSALQWVGGQTGEFAAISEWLRAPYWNLPQSESRARLDIWLRDRGRMQLTLEEMTGALRAVQPPALAHAANEVAMQIGRATSALNGGVASPRDWSQRFREALAAFAWPGDRARSSGDQQTIIRFHELLDEFGQLAAAVGAISRDTALQWFTELAGRTVFQPAAEDGVVTISGVFADPVVTYDGIWIAGLHSDALPQAVQPDPFLPLAAQLRAGIPAASAPGRFAESQQLMHAWRAATTECVLSAPARSEDLELLPSPLLAQWPTTDNHVSNPGAALWLPLRIRREGLLESFEDLIGVSWPLERLMPSGSRSLELQNQCPFRAYAELRLGSTELDAPEPGVAADVRGQILHGALQIFWNRVGDWHALQALALAPAQLDGIIESSVAQAATRTVGPPAEVRSFSMLRECRRAVRLIRELCAVEIQRDPFRVQHTEFDTALKVAGAQMKLRIDRIDALASGGRAILDYKSGQRSTADWYGERPSHPQLLAYLAALGDDVIAMATVNVTAKEVRFEGVADTPERLPKVRGVQAPEGVDSPDSWSLRRREWLGRVETLAAGFVAGLAAVAPKPGACDYCHVKSICRIADQNLADADVDAQELS